ncbi:MAG: TIGR02449 family protein [Coxiella sp. (in: Bacteria)]|nr:MAG: TIGR02449 family protein [Coxiella sp. (in: g-proteobacteria)]
MSIVELNNLEFQVDTLIGNLEKTQSENHQLRSQLANSNREKMRLKDRNQKAAVKIKRIISQLKEELA